MATIVLIHSVLGLRAVEVRAAHLLRAAGHEVSTPDLHAGQAAATVEDGFAIKDRIGWSRIVRRAHEAVRDVPATAVLAGFSMGAGVVHELLPHRPDTAGVLLLHGLAAIPACTSAGLPVHVHLADQDPFALPADVAAWQAATVSAGADPHVFSYPGAGHFYTDAELPDHDPAATTLTWHRVLAFLRTRAGPR